MPTRELPADPLDRIRAEFARRRRRWDARNWEYVHDVGLLLRRIGELEAVEEFAQEAPTRPATAIGKHTPEYAKGWRAACAFIADEVAAELTRRVIAGWDVHRMRQAVGELVERVRRMRVDP